MTTAMATPVTTIIPGFQKSRIMSMQRARAKATDIGRLKPNDLEHARWIVRVMRHMVKTINAPQAFH